MLISFAYFKGDRNIPNITYEDVSSLVTKLINKYEKEYLVGVLGYELYKLFSVGLVTDPVPQKYLDLLLGLDFTGYDGRLKQWTGLITPSSSSIAVTTGDESGDFYFTVDALLEGTSSYSNPLLLNKNYKVTQRGFGPLEWLKDDESNVSTADIKVRPAGGFDLLKNVIFSLGDKYLIEMQGTVIDLSGYVLTDDLQSPIADYVYCKWLRRNRTHTSGVGEVKQQVDNAVIAEDRHKYADAWNSMVSKTEVLVELLETNISLYPGYYFDTTNYKFLGKVNWIF